MGPAAHGGGGLRVLPGSTCPQRSVGLRTGTLCRALATCRGLGGAQPVGLRAGFNNVGIEGDAVDDRGDQARIGEDTPHSLNGRLLASPMLALSPRSVMLEQQFGSARVDLDTVHLIEQK